MFCISRRTVRSFFFIALVAIILYISLRRNQQFHISAHPVNFNVSIAMRNQYVNFDFRRPEPDTSEVAFNRWQIIKMYDTGIKSQ